MRWRCERRAIFSRAAVAGSGLRSSSASCIRTCCVGPELLHEAVAHWLERYADQRFSLTDAVSFEVMRRERLKTAFAYDRDFETAGFELLA